MAQQEFVDFEVDGLDLSNVKPMEGGAFKLVEEGSYIVDVTNVTQDKNKNDKAYIKVEYTIAEGQENDAAAAYTGQKVWGNYYLTQAAQGRLVQLMQACGAPLDKFRASAIFGARLRIDVVHNKGDNYTNEQGNVKEGGTFANPCKERTLDEGAAQQSAPATPPPVTKAGAGKPAAPTKPTANGQARRA